MKSLAHLSLATFLFVFPLFSFADDDSPNVVLIMCDDLGWGDVGFNGGTTIQTPHLDAMAANGLKLNRFYAAAPVCSPTRGSVVTGRHPFRYGIYTANTGHLKRDEFSLYEAVKTKGYRTGHFGKWHMGTLTTDIKDANRGKPGDTSNYSSPWHHQVDLCLATESKVPTHDPMIYPTKRSSKRLGWFPVDPEKDEWAYYGTHYWTGEKEMVPLDSPQLQGTNARILLDAAIPFIEDSVSANTPFFTIIWFQEPHLPVVAAKEYTDLYPNTSEYEANYYGCITALDVQVGRLRETLRALGIADNTIVTFCSDNGPEGSAKAPGSAAHFRGRKRSLYEGGIRVPGLIEWPAKIPPGSVSDLPTGTVDYFLTLQEAIGFDLEDPDRPMDGISLVPLFAGEMKERPSPLGFQDRKQHALSDNRYKIYSGDQGESWELYDLLEDPSESDDLAAENPDLLASMVTTFKAWQASCARSDAGEDYQ